MSDLDGARARKKAQTRGHIRTTAHELFAQRGFEPVTIADVAQAAGVADQTVFNHFSTKEELFFDGRASWVDEPATAVGTRAPGTPALTALRQSLVQITGTLVSSHTCPQRRAYSETIQASPALLSHERELVHVAEVRLAAALQAAWTTGDGSGPAEPTALAPLIAAAWIGAIRALLVQQRAKLTAGADPQETAADAMGLAAQLLVHLESAMTVAYREPPAAYLPVAVARAG